MKILTIVGSPRKGNSEAIALKLKEILSNKKVDNEIILLRERNIERCDGCVDYCNRHLDCQKKDDMPTICSKMKQADGYIFIFPNYFKMPPGIFKDFIDRCSIFFTAQTDLSKKRAIVIAVGADEVLGINIALDTVSENFCKTLGIRVVAKKSFRSKSELNENYNDILENNLNPNIIKDLNEVINNLIWSFKK